MATLRKFLIVSLSDKFDKSENLLVEIHNFAVELIIYSLRYLTIIDWINKNKLRVKSHFFLLQETKIYVWHEISYSVFKAL
jgi:hypothetical protein